MKNRGPFEMSDFHPFRVALVAAAALLLAHSAPARPRRGAQQSQFSAQAPPEAPGKELFISNCSRCHGLDGSGGEGPNIQQSPEKLGADGMAATIKGGVAGTGMPAFSNLSDGQIRQIVSYVRGLTRLPASDSVLHGDASRGESLYQANSCSECHMIRGQGGTLGPELTQIGTIRTVQELRDALADPGANLPKTQANRDRGKWTEYLICRAVLGDGQIVEGMRINSDSFVILLEDAQGNLHSLSRTDLKSLEPEPGKSFMPSYGGKLSASQLDDLIAYLATLKTTP
jgi:cytochrome c oxidase cbb3-type subunit III